MSAIRLKTEREFHDEKSSTYWLPKDEDEQLRLTGQHFALKGLFGGNILSSARQTLNFNKELSILDIGCGSGVWSMDMSIESPTCSYFGCDIVNVVNEKTRPKNFTFELTNVVKGLPYQDNTFDFVQIRYLVYALKEEEWPIAIEEALRVTKTGGFLQLIEHDIKDHHGNNATHRFADSVHVVSNSRGQNARIGKELERMVGEVGGAEVVQSECKQCNMSDDNGTAKRFAWNWYEVAKGMMPAIKSVLGLKDEQDEEKFLADLWHSLRTDDYDYIVYAVLFRKMEN